MFLLVSSEFQGNKSSTSVGPGSVFVFEYSLHIICFTGKDSHPQGQYLGFGLLDIVLRYQSYFMTSNLSLVVVQCSTLLCRKKRVGADCLHCLRQSYDVSVFEESNDC